MIWSNTISMFLVLRIRLMEMNGSSMGNVSFQNFCQPVTPSIMPAS